MSEGSSSASLTNMSIKEPEFPMKGLDGVDDPRERVEDLKLFNGEYIMKGYVADIMIKKGPEIKKETYDIMTRFQHNSVIRHLNFYPDSNAGRLVVPILKTSFKFWINNEGKGLLIDGKGDMSLLFKTMITDICDAVKELIDKKILIKNFDYKNLYMANEDIHRILILVTEAEHLESGVPKVTLWKPVRELIQWCYKECQSQPTFDAARYINFIGTERFTVKSLRTYPQNWDNHTKGEYMLSLIAAHHIWSAMRSTGISWPIKDGKLPDLLSDIVKHHSDKGFTYDPKIRFDHANLIRNTYKHFDQLSADIKRRCRSKQGFLEKLEQWSPTLWQDLYDALGWP